jgi:Family of unknown function (DUF5397)
MVCSRLKIQEATVVGPGFSEGVQAGFSDAEAMFGQASVGEIRRFGPVGPAYEVLSVKATGDVEICVIESGERLDYGLADFLADPIALTIP